MKAYKVYCRDDDHGAEVVFAKRAKDVDRRSNTENCDCEFIDRRIERAPRFDKYAPGPVTVAQYLAEGWYWSCSGCHKEQVTAEDSPLISDDGDVYCDADCIAKMLANWKMTDDKHESVVRLIDSGKRLLESIRTEV